MRTSTRSGPRRRAWDVVLAVLLSLSGLWIVHECLFVPIEALLAHVPDDSLFYFQIAWNLPSSHRFTYDGLHDTYAFQPLWQLVLSLLAFLFEDREAFLRCGLLLLGGLHLATGCVLHRSLRAPLGELAAAATAAFWLLDPALLSWSLDGKENVLYALLLAGTLALAAQELGGGRPRAARGLALGLLCGLAVLARVNALGFVLLLLLVLLVAAARGGAGSRGPRLASVLLVAAGAALVVLPWVAYARFAFGTVLPVSGALKLGGGRGFVTSTWGVEWLSPGHFLRALAELPPYALYLGKHFAAPFGRWYLTAAVLAALGAGATWLGRRSRAAGSEAERRLDAGQRVAGGLLLAWGIGNALMNCALLPGYVRYGRWYAVPEVLLLAVGFGLVTRAALSPPALGAKLAAVPLVLLGLRGARVSGLPAWPHAGAVLGGVALVAVAGLVPSLRIPSLRARAGAVLPALAVGIAALDLAPSFERTRTQAYEVRSRLHRLGLWTAEHVPEDVVLGAWSSGILTYFSGRHVVSLEGLANDLDYLREGRYDRSAYVRANGIQYVFGPGRRHPDGSYEFGRLPEGTYEVEWVPFPGFDLRWNEMDTYMLVRPEGTHVTHRFEAGDFPFGLWRPPTHATSR